jgi:hypothetical protein
MPHLFAARRLTDLSRARGCRFALTETETPRPAWSEPGRQCFCSNDQAKQTP